MGKHTDDLNEVGLLTTETLSISRKDLIAGRRTSTGLEVREQSETYNGCSSAKIDYLSAAAELLAEFHLKARESSFVPDPGEEVAGQ